jgi:hypothetical protein
MILNIERQMTSSECEVRGTGSLLLSPNGGQVDGFERYPSFRWEAMLLGNEIICF